MRLICCFILLAVLLNLVFISGCKKQPTNNTTPIDNTPPPPPPPSYAGMNIITQSFNEDFTYDKDYLKTHKWVFINNSKNTQYEEWRIGDPRGGNFVYYALLEPALNGEPWDFAYAGFPLDFETHSKASSKWMFTPPVLISNGDKINLYTKFTGGADATNLLDTLQVLEIRLNETDTTTQVGTVLEDYGKFSKVVGSIRKEIKKQWVKKEFTITGLTAPIQSRIAFRYYFPNDNIINSSIGAIGIDALQYIKQ